MNYRDHQQVRCASYALCSAVLSPGVPFFSAFFCFSPWTTRSLTCSPMHVERTSYVYVAVVVYIWPRCSGYWIMTTIADRVINSINQLNNHTAHDRLFFSTCAYSLCSCYKTFLFRCWDRGALWLTVKVISLTYRFIPRKRIVEREERTRQGQ